MSKAKEVFLDSYLGAYLLLALVFVGGFGVTYLLSIAGEPQSVWIMCDIMGICHAN